MGRDEAGHTEGRWPLQGWGLPFQVCFRFEGSHFPSLQLQMVHLPGWAGPELVPPPPVHTQSPLLPGLQGHPDRALAAPTLWAFPGLMPIPARSPAPTLSVTVWI